MWTSIRGLPRAWRSIEIPGVRPHREKFATYSRFEAELLPPAPAETSDFAWLSARPILPTDHLGEPSDSASTDLSIFALDQLLSGRPSASSLRRFAEQPELRSRLRSTTDCYFDLGDHVVDFGDDGALVHVLSDSQWCLHWLVYGDRFGNEAVLVTDHPVGFALGPDDRDAFPDEPNFEVCSESFAEFLWRFWVENELWFLLARSDHVPTSDEQTYLEHYRREHKH